MTYQHLLILGVLSLIGGCQNQVDLRYFQPNNTLCYDRQQHNNLMIVDSHHHFRPYGGQALDYQKLIKDINKAGVLFVNGYGIGQTLDKNSQCDFPSKCPEVTIKPTLTNDIANAENRQKWPSDSPIVNLSMSFLDLNKPEIIKQQIEQLQQQYPGVFNWAGEVNLVKQALFSHGHRPTAKEKILKWQPFMELLRKQNIPIAIHADIGNDKEPLKYLPLFDHVLKTYPKNRIIWLHMGVSKEQIQLDPARHIDILTQRLSHYPHLYVDLSWRILHQNYFNTEQKQQQYLDLFHRFPQRFITGSDIVAHKNTSFSHYKNALLGNSSIFSHLNDNAYRLIFLGQNYFKLAQMPYVAPKVCVKSQT